MSSIHATPAYRRAAREARAIFTASLPMPCIDCGRAVEEGQLWDVGHVLAAVYGGGNSLSNFGPSHRRCNRRAGGRMGARRQQSKARVLLEEEKRMPKW